ncbi:hypothetical protein NUSPORA_01681 [Nucleospora cyclopteri]
MASTELKEIKTKLEEMQNKLDDRFDEYLKEEFGLKMKYQKLNKDLLDERDKILKSLKEEELKEFMTNALDNFPEIHSRLPIVQIEGENCYDCDFIKFIKAEFLEGYKMEVTVDLFENPYVEEKQLKRTFNLETSEDTCMALTHKIHEEEHCPFFAFFENDEEALDLFDLFHEFYLNLSFYALNDVGEEN